VSFDVHIRHFKNVLLATRKSRGRINYELVVQGKTRPKPVSAVHYSPHLTHTPNHHQLADFRSHGTRVRVKQPSNQVTPKHPITYSKPVSVYFSNCVAQRQIYWFTMAHKHH
jgi:hypothetical protein